MKIILGFIATIATFLWLVGAFIDAGEFNDAVKSNYKTPWYTANWFISPYTNFQLKGKPTVEYWTQNAIKSEEWLVREVTFSDKTFWTILKRVEKNSGDK